MSNAVVFIALCNQYIYRFWLTARLVAEEKTDEIYFVNAKKRIFSKTDFVFLLIAFGEPLARETKWAYLDCRLGWWALRKSVERSVKSQSVWSRFAGSRLKRNSQKTASFWLLAKWNWFLAKQTQRTWFFVYFFANNCPKTIMSTAENQL